MFIPRTSCQFLQGVSLYMQKFCQCLQTGVDILEKDVAIIMGHPAPFHPKYFLLNLIKIMLFPIFF